MSAAIPGGGRSEIERLIETWRKRARANDGANYVANQVAAVVRTCADELDKLSALLTAAGSAPVTTHGHHFSDTTWAGQLVREGEEIAPSRAGQAQPPKRCPRCDSPSPELHPSVQWEGEVQPCSDPWHSQPTNRTPVAVPDMAWQNIDRALVHLPDDQLCGVWPDGSGLRGAHIKHLIVELRGAAVTAQAPPPELDPRIVSAVKSIRANVRACMDRGIQPDVSVLHAAVCLEAVFGEQIPDPARPSLPVQP